MKTHKLIFAAILAALGFAHIASAQTEIYLSGAPATRAIWNQAIYNTLVAKSTGSPTITKYWSGSSYNSANQIILTGGNINGSPVTIYGSWTGSTGGNQSVAINPPASNTTLEVGFLLLSAANPGGSNTNLTNVKYPQVNLSDTLQSTLPFNGTTSTTTPTTSYVALTEATTASPAITGFEFVANKGAPASLSNLTTNLAQQLFTSPGIPLALFSGNSADHGTKVYPVGRDIASGARYILLAETGIGTANSSTLIQYEPAVTTGTITDIVDNPAPGGTINLISFDVGNGGYPSFSAVETVLAASSSNASVGYAVSYVTDSDAVTAVNTGGAKALSWNGVPYSVAAIQEGQYTYWSFLHVYYNNVAPGHYIATNFPLSKTFADYLSTDLSTDTNYTVGTAAILSSSLHVSRPLDGGAVTPNY